MKTVDDVLTRIPGAKNFLNSSRNKWILAIPLEKVQLFLTCFKTPFGQYWFKRLPFGIKSAPEVYQRVMQEMFGNIVSCGSVVDDLMIWEGEDKEHEELLSRILDRAREVRLRLNQKKCKMRVL